MGACSQLSWAIQVELLHYIFSFLDHDKFLSYFSSNQIEFEELFLFEDKTGILCNLRQMFTEELSSEEAATDQRAEELDVKIMFYELIKLICDFENQNRNTSCRQIHKIDGFQQLSNKLFLNRMKTLRKENI